MISYCIPDTVYKRTKANTVRMCVCVCVCFSCSVMSDSLRAHGTVAYQAPLSMEFSRQEYWSGLPFPSPMHASEK